MDMVNRYDIYWVDLNPVVGSEISKVRPAVVISPDELNHHLKTVIIAPLTSTIHNYPFRLKVMVADKMGEIALDQLRSVDKSRLKSKLSSLPSEKCKALQDLLHCLFEE